MRSKTRSPSAARFKCCHPWLSAGLQATLAGTLLALVMLSGCAEKRVKTEDPVEIEKQRQEHLDMTRRELQET